MFRSFMFRIRKHQRRRHIGPGNALSFGKKCLIHVLLGAVKTVAQSRQNPGELPFTSKIEQLFLILFGHYNVMLTEPD